MKNTWFISDTHFSHRKIVLFTDSCGNITRQHPEEKRPFIDHGEHDEYLVQEWNKLVKNGDKVYHLGDVMMGSEGFNKFKRLNGDIHLVLGNHDRFPIRDWLECSNVKDVQGCIDLHKKKWILTHIPVHDNQLGRWKFNVHGHTHHYNIDHKQYINVSCEQIGCKPIHIDEIVKKANALGV